MFFFFQRDSKESRWDMERADQRERIIAEVKPAFSTVLDLSMVPDDNDWTKVRYRGPLYFDFDADGDLDLACEQFKNFLGKLDTELSFDVTQARFFASGSKGFHIEIPQECFIPKLPAAGTPWLPYIYREIAQTLIVDTLDLNVYTGKRGRQWRTVNVQRENGCYKIPLTLEEALTIDPLSYLEMIKEPRPLVEPTPPTCNAAFSMLFDRSKLKVVESMRGRKKRQEKANAILDPWKKAKRTPPTIEMIMAGEGIAEGTGFQALAMQLSIYAASVDMSLSDFLERCKGLCEKHVSDSSRYGSVEKRRNELERMYQYMTENSLYEFDVGPIVRLVKPGTQVSDLGVIDSTDPDDDTGPAAVADAEDDEGQPLSAPTTPDGKPLVDVHASVRRGIFQNRDGIFVRHGDTVESICRASVGGVESFLDPETGEFKGYEFDLRVPGKKTRRAMLSPETFTSAMKMKQFFGNHQLTYQGNDAETIALLDIMQDKASRSDGRVYVYPREGFFIMNNPEVDTHEPVKVFLTKDMCMTSVAEGEPGYFRLRYRPAQAVSSYDIDIHRAPDLGPQHIEALRDLFAFSKPSVVADLLGWFVACHYRSAYLYNFSQFPMLQVYGEAGAGKTQTVKMLAHLHWFMPERISIKSATACTPFALDCHASSSTSAPLILDEYKPRELRMHKGKHEKIKDVMKASYVGADIGERGTINRGSETHLAVIKSKATSPLCYMGEAIEMETAIIERSVSVNLTKALQTRQRTAAFERLQAQTEAISALGKALVEAGFGIDLLAMRSEMNEIRAGLKASLPDIDEGRKSVGDRLIFNRAVIIHGLRIMQRVLQRRVGAEFDEVIDGLISSRSDYNNSDDISTVTLHGQSEISKVMSRIALLSRKSDDRDYKIHLGKDYWVGSGWIELKVAACYDSYRRFCATQHEQALFDNLQAFEHALLAYSPCVDRMCLNSPLREDGSTERIVRLDMAKLAAEGVHSFR